MKRKIFVSNPNKDYLRSKYDSPIIANWRRLQGEPLRYLGLPGPDMQDVVEWQVYLGQFTTIERCEIEQHLIFLRANVKDIEHRLHSLYGEFDDILITGRDIYNISPRWPYDLVNLDFFGGLIYPDLNRPKALRKLIDNQSGYKRSFLLIITYDLRDSDSVGEKQQFLDTMKGLLEREFGPSTKIRTFIAQYKDSTTPDAARQALYTNFFLRDYGETAQYTVFSRPAIVYSGTGGVKMIHFVTEFHYRTAAHRVASPQSSQEIANLGVQELRDGELSPLALPILRLA